MTFKTLAICLEKLEKTSARNEITRILAELFKGADKNEIEKTVYLLLGRLAPAYENVVFNLADRMMILAIAEAYKKDPKMVRSLYKEKGDLGNVAQTFARRHDSKATVNEIYDSLRKVAEDEGGGSQERKISGIAKMLAELDPLSAKFLVRIPLGRLRLGFSDKTIIDALSVMESGDKSRKKEIEEMYKVLPDVGKLAARVKVNGVKKAEKYSPTFGVPILPILAQRLKSPTEMIKKMGEVAVEPKFDGLRVQIHFKRGEKVRAFTRNLNDVSHMFPELEEIGKYTEAKSVIFDSEAVGLDPKTKKMVDFQHTMQRRRKHDIKRLSGDIPLRFQIFDVLFENGNNLMNLTYLKRREKLEKLIKKNLLFQVDEYVVTDDPKIIEDKHKEELSQGLEGVIVKKADSKYISGRTGWRWVKMKEIEEARGKLADTVDCVVMGYTQGKGKRVKFGIGQFLAGVVDPGKNQKIKTVTKVGTGLTDEQFRELAKRLKRLTVKEKPKEYEVHKDLEPDFWTSPEVVVELAADEVTKSPKHTAGLALRFPRLVRFRGDKSVGDATSLKELESLYKLQKNS
ncbi:MAG: putative DNA ligase [Candidatus Woesebacteria bacterium GW2011_GWB1_43_14]|uniref:DNA ligase (ATP) n=1 Tax=Candidatus Woesebacteria bacterium GW2011_GWB1_43_14 TaxID=1618578 RepID=A0A0G1DMI9_9BACT|nr:MAG: putative DNA ligase [Candidatus Woesebacteria bacterium GW2011_GWC1_42_9]KKS98859.1 MAG: putative DNA ligase [Candidatus Woesebacteria bacterium GW2011_GWB1_43_14]